MNETYWKHSKQWIFTSFYFLCDENLKERNRLLLFINRLIPNFWKGYSWGRWLRNIYWYRKIYNGRSKMANDYENFMEIKNTKWRIQGAGRKLLFMKLLISNSRMEYFREFRLQNFHIAKIHDGSIYWRRILLCMNRCISISRTGYFWDRLFKIFFQDWKFRFISNSWTN